MVRIDPGARRTMIAALVPDAEPLVGHLRARLDPTARRGLGAHLTLVYPFVEPARITDATLADLRAAVADLPPVTVTFGALSWFGERVLWLAPEPADPFRQIATQVVAGVDGVPAPTRELVPHLTVGLRRPLPELRAAAAEVAPGLPLTTRVERVALMVRGSERWGVAAEADLWGISPAGPCGRGSPASP